MAAKGWFTRFLECAGSLSGASPLAPIDAAYGTAWWGPATAASGGFAGSPGRLPLVAAGSRQ
ncbi:hypothetical protein BayCH28_10120 [Mycolicibacterium sp. CH28]|uniref:hypothetical protein n=1 Tax=Mycolicibacterium sp. CH28 TaxID=2512237 RepID=UPI0010815795|nr:hypothetical protein [Mycolicibacterium sp. CH28]TGD88120.1 hypothetical protein BayCH28_10120 [Mycolicibacterium sp. CH28]